MASNPKNQSRKDGRSASELRPITIAFDELERADGSARFGFGSTASLASFSGPMEVRVQKDHPTRATLEVVHRPLEGIGATPSRAIESSLSALLPPLLNLGRHPRSLIQLIVQSLSPSKLPSTSSSVNAYQPGSEALEIDSKQTTWPQSSTSALAPANNEDEDDEEEILYRPNDPAGLPAPTTSIPFSSRASGINATALAILCAGSLSLTAIPIGIALALLPPAKSATQKLVLDPTMEEEALASARFGFAWAIGHGLADSDTGVNAGGTGMDVDEDEDGMDMELVWVESEGSFSRAEFQKAMQLSKAGAKQVWAEIRDAAEEHVSKTVR